MHQSVYHSRDIQAWEQRWFSHQNSAYGLMQQAAWSIVQRLIDLFHHKKIQIKNIAVCCGSGNNAGDGYLVALYLAQAGWKVDIYTAPIGTSASVNLAYQQVLRSQANVALKLFSGFQFQRDYDVYIDALFGIGLNRDLSEVWQEIIHSMNQKEGLKVSIDLPSGLDANTGQVLGAVIQADITYSLLGLKAGLFTGQGKTYTGQVETIALIPVDTELKAIATLSPKNINLTPRKADGHKGSYGHVLIVGGHADMGGAVIMAAESAFHAGAGKVSIVCDAKHHMAILARAPNIMLKDINALENVEIQKILKDVDAVAFGMGLGRDDWAEKKYLQWIELLMQSDLEIVLDADALWFLAKYPTQFNSKIYLTPHPGEAATLLECSVKAIEADRMRSISLLHKKYAGQWVLKGAGSLILESHCDAQNMWICTAGNPGMGTGGMGDVLAGMIASLKAQFHHEIALHQIVTLHALAGDYLAQAGIRGLQAQHMREAVYYVVNHATECMI